ncbi:Rof/RNase P-like protein [Mycena rebaudengoi]|nr:Rof/RNase P-like protein [Mycena rebaudengoi]
MHPKLLKADLHGSIVTVHQTKNTAIHGISGVVIHETERTLKVVTKENKLKGAFVSSLRVFISLILPKQNSIFTLAVPLYSTLPASHDPSPLLPILEPGENLQTVLDAPHLRFELHRNQFCFRSADRAERKFKAKETIEL